MNLSDEKLYQLCQQYGERARFWRQKFIGLLPEVNRRELYKKKGFLSIFEFAAKLAGISKEQVQLALNLERRFDNKPALKKLLVEGKVSINKLAMVVSVANQENQEMFADQARLLSQKSLETLVRDEKMANKPIPLMESLRAQTRQSATELQFSDEVKQKLLELQNKGIDINQLILGFLKKRELEIAQEKEEITAEQKPVNVEEAEKRFREALIFKFFEHKPSRYIPVKIKKILQKEYGNKCSISNCRKEAVEIHHTQRFALEKIHDPHLMAPLCREHHQIAHSIDQKFQEKRKEAVVS